MNAFRYSPNEDPAKPMKTPLIAVVGLSNEGEEGKRLQQLADVLDAHGMSFSDFNKLTA